MKLLRSLFRRADVNITDVLLIALMGWWSLWMLLPFSAIVGSPAYQPMWDIAPRLVWGYGALALLAVKVWAIVTCRWKVRGSLLTAMVMWWTFIAVMAYYAGPRGPGWGLIGIVAIAALWRTMQIAATGSAFGDACLLDIDRE